MNMKTLLALLLLIPSLSWSDITGNELLEICEGDETYEYLHCMGIIQGSVDGLLFSNSNMKSSKEIDNDDFKICDSSKIEMIGQARDVVVEFLKKNPKQRHQHYILLVNIVISEWLSCGYWSSYGLREMLEENGFNF